MTQHINRMPQLFQYLPYQMLLGMVVIFSRAATDLYSCVTPKTRHMKNALALGYVKTIGLSDCKPNIAIFL